VKFFIVPVVAVAIVLRVWINRRRRRPNAAIDAGGTGRASQGRMVALETRLGEVGLVAGREIRERVRGRIFRIGTVVMLLAVAAAIIIPAIHSGSSGPTAQTIGIVGTLPPETGPLIDAAAAENDDAVRLVDEPSLAAAQAGLRTGKVDLAIVDSTQILLNRPAAAKGSHADPGLVQSVADYLGVVAAYHQAGLTSAQASLITKSKPVPVHTLLSGSSRSADATSIVGLVLLFLMLQQYNTWILIGVMQEKSSRVVEVLLATLRPIKLLSGKVLGIGLVALGQATLIAGFALIVGAAVGSDLLKGTGPMVLGSQLLWLFLGYAFYCWVYAAAGSTAERQDQVQTLALPLSLPILVGYVFSVTVAGTGRPDLLFKVFAYLPPTAPFCMSVLVGLHQATWWEFTGSALISVVATVGMAIFAARVYRRAVLRTGGRVKIGELLAR
jgi:ABC-2 type transport system permease protein